MKLCKNDPLENIVRNELKANPVKIPRSSIQPLQTFTRTSGNINYPYSDLASLTKGDPIKLSSKRIQTSKVSDKISFKPSKKVNLKNFMKIADGFMKHSEIPQINFSSLFEKDTEMSFLFSDVTEKWVLPSVITEKLQGRVLSDEHLANALVANKTELFIIYSVFICSGFELLIEKSHTNKVNLDILSKLEIESRNRVSVTSTKEFKISFNGEPRTFAFKCFPIHAGNKPYSSIIAKAFESEKNISFGDIYNCESDGIILNNILSNEPVLIDI